MCVVVLFFSSVCVRMSNKVISPWCEQTLKNTTLITEASGGVFSLSLLKSSVRGRGWEVSLILLQVL